MTSPKQTAVLFCELGEETRSLINAMAEALEREASTIGENNLGLTADEVREGGLFHGAVERLRGIRAASTTEKSEFMRDVLGHLKFSGLVADWEFTGAGERHDYQVRMPDGRLSIVETKGCLDGNNTNIFERPPQADEFIIWSLCQNPGADPRHNAWSGIHTRLGAEVIHKRQRVDGLVIWDMRCGTPGRPCPKLQADPTRGTELTGGRRVPPPCLYLFPRTVPDPRNNPAPPSWSLEEVGLLKALHAAFKGDAADVVSVRIKTRMQGTNVQRQTALVREGQEFTSSKWTTLRRARR